MPLVEQFAQRKLVVPIKLLVMLSDTVKRLFISSLQHKIEKHGDLLKKKVSLFGLRLSCDKF